MTVHTTVVFTRYMILAVSKRESENPRLTVLTIEFSRCIVIFDVRSSSYYDIISLIK